MAGETYVKRHGAGFVDLPSQTTRIDSQFLNAVEAALLRLLGEDPAADEVGVWVPGSNRFVFQKITNAQVDAAAAVAYSKLALSNSIVNADINSSAAIAKSKLATLNIVNADIDAAAAIARTKIADVPIGTTLPGSPTDGDEAILVDSTTVPTYAWKFQWSSTASKWICVGGSPWANATDTGGATTSTTFVTIGTPPSITVPRAGAYVVGFGGRAYLSSGLEENTQLTLTKNGTTLGASYDLSVTVAIRGNAGAVYATNNVISKTAPVTGLAASDVLSLKGLSAAGQSIGHEKRYISVMPVYVT